MTTEELQRVKQLLLNNREVFSCTGEPLGRTKLVKHPIRTETGKSYQASSQKATISSEGRSRQRSKENVESRHH